MVDTSNLDIGKMADTNMEDNVVKVDVFRHRVDELFTHVDKLGERVNEVEQFYLATSEKQLNTSSMKKQQHDASRKDASAPKRMQELMRQFGTILRQITQHKWAWPFMQPVDVEGLGLHDYYEVIDRPMDFSTIKNQMEVKDGTGYKHVREIYAEVQLVFNNAMKYNDETSDVYSMAKALLEKFEEKWQQLLPKVMEEDRRREEEKAEAQLKKQLAQEAANAKLARDLSNELNDANMQLEELKEIMIQKCRKMSIEEKRELGIALSQLCPEDLAKALEVVSQEVPTFQATAQEVDLDITAQSEFTLWRLKFFVKDVLEAQGNNSKSHPAATNTVTNASKRKREIRNALAKTTKRRDNKKNP